jgi:hypothetical protein
MGQILKKAKKNKNKKQRDDDEDDAPRHKKKSKKMKASKKSKKAKVERVPREGGAPVGSRELKPKQMRYCLRLSEKGISQRGIVAKLDEKYGVGINQSTVCRMLNDPRLKKYLKKKGV